MGGACWGLARGNSRRLRDGDPNGIPATAPGTIDCGRRAARVAGGRACCDRPGTRRVGLTCAGHRVGLGRGVALGPCVRAERPMGAVRSGQGQPAVRNPAWVSGTAHIPAGSATVRYTAMPPARRARNTSSLPAPYPRQSSSSCWASEEITSARSSNTDLSCVTRHRSMISRPQQRRNRHEVLRRFAHAQLNFVPVQRLIANKRQIRRFNVVLGSSTDPQRCFFVLEPAVVNPHPLPIEGHQQGSVRSGVENERYIAFLSQTGKQDMPFHVGPTGGIAESSSQHAKGSACADSSR